MRIALLLSTVCLTGYATKTVAQQPSAQPKPVEHHTAATVKLADVAGTWTIESAVKTADGKDTAVTSELVVPADGNSLMTNLAGRDPIPTRIVARGGDSLVTEAGPFQSVVRAGQTVTTRETLHFKGDNVSGTIEARYASGDVVKGSIKGTRKK